MSNHPVQSGLSPNVMPVLEVEMVQLLSLFGKNWVTWKALDTQICSGDQRRLTVLPRPGSLVL